MVRDEALACTRQARKVEALAPCARVRTPWECLILNFALYVYVYVFLVNKLRQPMAAANLHYIFVS